MAYGTEKPLGRQGRIVIAVLTWIIGAYVFIVLWHWMGLWVVPLLALALWATVDYVKRGGMYETVEHSVSYHFLWKRRRRG